MSHAKASRDIGLSSETLRRIYKKLDTTPGSDNRTHVKHRGLSKSFRELGFDFIDKMDIPYEKAKKIMIEFNSGL